MLRSMIIGITSKCNSTICNSDCITCYGSVEWCTNCGNELEYSWNACPNCGNLILQVGGQTPNKNEMGTNSVQNSTVFSSLDATLDEINSIQERAKKNSENRMKAMKYAITSSIILAFVEGRW